MDREINRKLLIVSKAVVPDISLVDPATLTMLEYQHRSSHQAQLNAAGLPSMLRNPKASTGSRVHCGSMVWHCTRIRPHSICRAFLLQDTGWDLSRF
jgi:hypothetical protein